MSVIELDRPKSAGTLLLRLEVEDFLFHEPQLLDAWRLPEWSELFTDDGRYEVASMSEDQPWEASPATSIFLISDDRAQLRLRAERLMKKTAHCEYPHSKTRHIIANVRCRPVGEEIAVEANFVAYRTKSGRTSRYMGEAHYRLVRDGMTLRIRAKRCALDLDTLNDQGRMTIIL